MQGDESGETKTTARRSNRERAETTQRALLDAARDLIVERGYADTSTPDIVAAAGTTRGALYHHFADKRGLFRALLERESAAVAADIRAAPAGRHDPRAAWSAGALAYLTAMEVPGRTRLLLVEGPAILGAAEMRQLDDDHAAATLVEGLVELRAVPATASTGTSVSTASAGVSASTGPTGVSVAAVAGLLSAAFDHAALAVDEGADRDEQAAALVWLLDRVAGD